MTALNAIPFITWCAIAPVMLVVGAVYIIIRVGAAAVIGILIGTIAHPLVRRLQKRLSALEKSRMKAKDERVSAIEDFLSTVRVTKMIAGEGFWVERIKRLRETELDHQWRLQMGKYFHATLMVSIPVLQSVLTFTFQELVFEEKMELVKAFEVLSMFTVMQQPAKMMGFMWTLWNTLCVALGRIDDFVLNCEDCEKDCGEGEAAVNGQGRRKGGFKWKLTERVGFLETGSNKRGQQKRGQEKRGQKNRVEDGEENSHEKTTEKGHDSAAKVAGLTSKSTLTSVPATTHLAGNHLADATEVGDIDLMEVVAAGKRSELAARGKGENGGGEGGEEKEDVGEEEAVGGKDTVGREDTTADPPVVLIHPSSWKWPQYEKKHVGGKKTCSESENAKGKKNGELAKSGQDANPAAADPENDPEKSKSPPSGKTEQQTEQQTDGTNVDVRENDKASDNSRDSSPSEEANLFTLSIPTEISIRRGDLVIVQGPVGCGKTALISALLGIMEEGGERDPEETGERQFGRNTAGRSSRIRSSSSSPPGGEEEAVLKRKIWRLPTVAYCPQSAWCLQESIRNNITFGEEYDEARMKRVRGMKTTKRVRGMKRELSLIHI